MRENLEEEDRMLDSSRCSMGDDGDDDDEPRRRFDSRKIGRADFVWSGGVRWYNLVIGEGS